MCQTVNFILDIRKADRKWLKQRNVIGSGKHLGMRGHFAVVGEIGKNRRMNRTAVEIDVLTRCDVGQIVVLSVKPERVSSVIAEYTF